MNSYVQTWLLYLFLCQQMNILIVALAGASSNSAPAVAAKLLPTVEACALSPLHMRGYFFDSCLAPLSWNLASSDLLFLPLCPCKRRHQKCRNTVIQAEPIEIMREPLTKSRSPRDFWGCRWNLVVHGLLKCGHGQITADTDTFISPHAWVSRGPGLAETMPTTISPAVVATLTPRADRVGPIAGAPYFSQ